MLNGSIVLLVDDEEELLENLTFDLREDVEEFVTAGDGNEALELFKKHQHEISCIITDIKMPRMNGLQFIQEVRKINTNVPVVFLTAHGDEEQMHVALSLDARDFISKPYDTFELRESIILIHEDIEEDILQIAEGL